MKKIKYWKSIGKNLSLKEALKVLDSHCYNNLRYDRIGIRLEGKVIDQYDDYKTNGFTFYEAISGCWEIVIPDIDTEEILLKARELVKNEHFLRLTNDRIDNMDINDIWHSIISYVNLLDENNKYRIIKHFIENKLYKKT